MKLSLVVLTTGKPETKEIPITLPQFLIGRDPKCNMRPASAVVSPKDSSCALTAAMALADGPNCALNCSGVSHW